jgi:hypothetical protein
MAGQAVDNQDLGLAEIAQIPAIDSRLNPFFIHLPFAESAVKEANEEIS